MRTAGEPSKELPAKAAGLPEHNQAAEAGVPEGTELVAAAVAAHTPKRKRGPRKCCQDSRWRWREKDH